MRSAFMRVLRMRSAQRASDAALQPRYAFLMICHVIMVCLPDACCRAFALMLLPIAARSVCRRSTVDLFADSDVIIFATANMLSPLYAAIDFSRQRRKR